MTTLVIGAYTVRIRLRPDNPAFPVYAVFRGDKLIGKSFSVPDLGCCQWLEQQEQNRVTYAKQAEQRKFSMRAWSIGRRGRPTKAEQERRAMLAQLEDIE